MSFMLHWTSGRKDFKIEAPKQAEETSNQQNVEAPIVQPTSVHQVAAEQANKNIETAPKPSE